MPGFDELAPVYPRLVAGRRAYLDAIDRLAMAEIPRGCRRLLDVGAGDGVRSRRIAAVCGIGELVMLEPSVAMQGASQGCFWTMRAEDLGAKSGEFDMITCLWNVLGHITERTEALRQFARLLAPEGRVILDVNHRYNARQYGAVATLGRLLRDRVAWSDTNGDVEFPWGKGHVFTERELMGLFGAAGLTVEKCLVVDYATGEPRKRSFEGQLFYVLRR